LCFLWGTNWIYICYVEESRPPLWSSGQSSWLQIQRSGFDSRIYHIFWEAVGLERGPLSLASTIEELLERKSSGSGLENRKYSRRDPLRWPRGTLNPQKLVLTSPTSGGRTVGIVRLWTQVTEIVCITVKMEAVYSCAATVNFYWTIGLLLESNLLTSWHTIFMLWNRNLQINVKTSLWLII
jgi:hypothetical protein